jgi:hypothetical protein
MIQGFWRWLVITAAGAAMAAATSAVAGDLASAKRDFVAARAALTPHFDGFSLDKTPQAPALLKREQAVIQQWAVDYLDTHPGATAKQVAAAIRGLGTDLYSSAAKLDGQTVLISAWLDEAGQAFIIVRRGGRFELAWTAADFAEAHVRPTDLRYAWSLKAARGTCRDQPDGPERTRCGPVYGAVGKLPDGPDGAHRFFVDATYAQPMGATVGAQLDVWEWDGRDAKPLFVKGYDYMIDQRGPGPTVRGDRLVTRVKGDFTTFFACGGCEGRQMDWTLRLTPGGVEDLGETSRAPELDLVDEAYDRIVRHKSAETLASPQVLAAMTRTVAGADPPDKTGYFGLGMLDDWRVTEAGGVRRLCVAVDAAGTQVFTIGMKAGRPRLLTVSDFPTDCKTLKGRVLRASE